MTLSLTSRPAIRGRVIPRLPATMQATGGLSVSKENGVWTLEPDWSQLSEVSVVDAANQQVWVFNSATEVYGWMSLETLLAATTFFSAATFVSKLNIQDFPSEAAAAAGGIPVGGLYRNGAALQIRTT